MLTCEVVITAIAPDKSRVVPDRGNGSKSGSAGSKSGSALARTQDETQAPMFEEHILAILDKRAFNRETVNLKQAATVLKNLGGMQREALRTSDEMRRWEAKAGR